jgi:hypothetical protein
MNALPVLHALLSFPPSMVNRKISKDMKECALTVWDKGWELDDIIYIIGVSRSSIFRWRAIFNEHGSVNRPVQSPHGLSCILTCAILTAIHTLYEEDSDLYLDELVL